jgi:hypothetical protein
MHRPRPKHPIHATVIDDQEPDERQAGDIREEERHDMLNTVQNRHLGVTSFNNTSRLLYIRCTIKKNRIKMNALGIQPLNMLFQNAGNILGILLSTFLHVLGTINDVKNRVGVGSRNKKIHEGHSSDGRTISKETHSKQFGILRNNFPRPVSIKETREGGGLEKSRQRKPKQNNAIELTFPCVDYNLF